MSSDFQKQWISLSLFLSGLEAAYAENTKHELKDAATQQKAMHEAMMCILFQCRTMVPSS